VTTEEWCYEDSMEKCPTGGWLTGHPFLVTCKVCIERYKLKDASEKLRKIQEPRP
jgi:hypothetical protein